MGTRIPWPRQGPVACSAPTALHCLLPLPIDCPPQEGAKHWPWGPGVSPSPRKTEGTATHRTPVLIPGSPLNLQDQECQRGQVVVPGEEEPRGSHEGTVRLGVPTQAPCLDLGLPPTPWLPSSVCTSAHGETQGWGRT